MNYIKRIENNLVAIIFSSVNLKKPETVAQKMRDEIIAFFNNNPNEKLELRFDGRARLCPEFTRELFKENYLGVYFKNISVHEAHALDHELIGNELRRAC